MLLLPRSTGNVFSAPRHSIFLFRQTITAFPSNRNPGGLHDFFSEADYFWPNPANPDGPYIELDGKSNPANFQGHRKALIALSVQMPVLTAAWRLTGKRSYGNVQLYICVPGSSILPGA
jgi:Alginate lyase